MNAEEAGLEALNFKTSLVERIRSFEERTGFIVCSLYINRIFENGGSSSGEVADVEVTFEPKDYEDPRMRL